MSPLPIARIIIVSFQVAAGLGLLWLAERTPTLVAVAACIFAAFLFLHAAATVDRRPSKP